MSFLLQALGLEEPEQQPSSSSWWTPDPDKGDYRDLKPANTQVKAYGKDFTDNAAVLGKAARLKFARIATTIRQIVAIAQLVMEPARSTSTTAYSKITSNTIITK